MELQRPTTEDERALLDAMASGRAGSRHSPKRAKLILALLDGQSLRDAARKAEMPTATARDWRDRYNEGGWANLLDIGTPRGGDFLARNEIGFWAERLVTRSLDGSNTHRAIPYGTSMSEPFHDQEAYRKHRISEFMLQAWSPAGSWKRPDLLTISRDFLREKHRTDTWTPDLQHFTNEDCQEYVTHAAAAVEVETSLWIVKQASELSYTIKQEDLEALRNWINTTRVPLFVVQVFYDEVHVLPFTRLESMIAEGSASATRDATTNKLTYMVSLSRGMKLCELTEPDVEGKVFKAPNGKVTVYGRLTGSELVNVNEDVQRGIAQGTLL
jgi:hypothetical protein